MRADSVAVQGINAHRLKQRLELNLAANPCLVTIGNLFNNVRRHRIVTNVTEESNDSNRRSYRLIVMTL